MPIPAGSLTVTLAGAAEITPGRAAAAPTADAVTAAAGAVCDAGEPPVSPAGPVMDGVVRADSAGFTCCAAPVRVPVLAGPVLAGRVLAGPVLAGPVLAGPVLCVPAAAGPIAAVAPGATGVGCAGAIAGPVVAGEAAPDAEAGAGAVAGER